MNDLKKCKNCQKYTLSSNCPKCKKETKQAHYKFIKLKEAKEENSDNF